MNEQTDVAVVGGGTVGILAALAAHKCKLRVIIFEKRNEPARNGERLFTLHLVAKKLLGELGIWERLREAVPIRRMRVRTPAGRWLKIDAFACQLSALAYTLAEHELTQALLNQLNSVGLQIEYGTQVQAVNVQPRKAILDMGDRKVETKLIIGADGQRSKIAQLTNLAQQNIRLPHDAVVARAKFDNLNNTAWQWIGTGDLFAVLPGVGGYANLIWSRPPAVAQTTAAWTNQRFNHELDQLCAEQLGPCQVAGERRVFKLHQVLRAPVANRVVLVGDSFHSIHPLAGQGLALGCGDITVLTSAFNRSDPGCNATLGAYRRARALRVATTRIITSRIAALGWTDKLLLETGASLPLGKTLALLANQP